MASYSPNPLENVDVRIGATCRLRDGVRLSATLYLPRHAAPRPSLATVTPYTADYYHHIGVFFADNGFPFVVVDCRGRGDSEGTFQPNLQEGDDGFDVVEWVAAQAFCNGKVGLWGGSYSGHAQWVTAKNRPPHLASIVPNSSPYLGVDFPFRKNIFYSYMPRWLLFTAGRAIHAQKFADNRFWNELVRRWYASGDSYAAYTRALGSSFEIMEAWLQHPCQGAYWDAYSPTVADYAAIDVPCLSITGMYDEDQLGALTHYRRHMAAAEAIARGKHYLVVGPWDHGGCGRPRAECAGLTFGAESVIDMLRLNLDWYRWTMDDGPKPALLQDRVTYYVTGEERWRGAKSLEDVTCDKRPLRFSADRNPTSVFAAGALGETCEDSGPDEYVYDPRRIDAEAVVRATELRDGFLLDQRLPLALDGVQLVYQTAALEADWMVCGFFELELWLSISGPDTDIYVTIYEVESDGAVVRLCADAVRARYRASLREEALVKTLSPQLYRFDGFPFVSRRIPKGSRLRLIVAPIGQLCEDTLPERNVGGGGEVSKETLSDARAVTVRLFRSKEYDSVLHVPVGRDESLPNPAESLDHD